MALRRELSEIHAVSRNSWIRGTFELPSGAKANQITEIERECLVAPVSGGKMAAIRQLRCAGGLEGFSARRELSARSQYLAPDGADQKSRLET